MKITCPHCNASLDVPDDLPLGYNVWCKSCFFDFQTTTEPLVVPVTSAPSTNTEAPRRENNYAVGQREDEITQSRLQSIALFSSCCTILAVVLIIIGTICLIAAPLSLDDHWVWLSISGVSLLGCGFGFLVLHFVIAALHIIAIYTVKASKR